MLYKKSGYPVESEIVLCTVTKIQHHSVFVKLDWYDKPGMLHISEISPGRIRNIREYVEEGKTIVCKVLSVDQNRGHIDVSLRRVTEHQRAAVLASVKQEMKSEKIIEVFCHEKKIEFKVLYPKIAPVLIEKFGFVHQAFNAIIDGTYAFEDTGLTTEEMESLKTLILSRIKPPQVEIQGKFKIISYTDNGVELIKEVLTKAIATDTKHLSLAYGGGGYYNLKITSPDFKVAEKVLKQVLDVIEPVFKEGKDCAYEFTRSEGKQIEG